MSKQGIKITIHGHPLVLKNSKQIVVNNGRRFIKSNPRVEAYQLRAIQEIIEQIGTYFKPMSGKIHARMLFYGAWKAGSETMPDLSNLYQLPEDLLESAGVIESDRLIESHDGSRRVYMCDNCMDRPTLKSGPNRGNQKPDCGAVKKCKYERVEIFLDYNVVNFGMTR